MFRDLRFASAILLSHHAGAEEAEHLANRIRERINTVARKEQTNCARICGHVLNSSDPESPPVINFIPEFATRIWL